MRGSKATRKGRPRPDRAPQGVPPILPPEALDKPPAVEDHEMRNAARMQGLLVPPSAAERSGLEEKGHKVPRTDSGLYLP